MDVRLVRDAGSQNVCPSPTPRRAGAWWTLLATAFLTILISAALVFAVEFIVRGSFQQTLQFFGQPFKPGWTTIALFALIILFFDALLGRPYHALFIVAPITLVLAFVGSQKAFYLGDPLYPTDFLYARQIMELMPLLVRQRPWEAAGFAAGGAVAVIGLVLLWRTGRAWSRRISLRGRLARLAIALPALVFFGSIMDYATFSWARDRLQIIPMMWDQKENYNSNGFAIAFALNVPMAKISAPEGYSEAAIKDLAAQASTAVTAPAEKPDIIVVMSESFWDPTQLAGTTITPDPLPTVRANRSGHILSPEFGGMTANVEFEALTGFSNAFLPYGSIPYQQYIRSPTPSLATFLDGEGYATVAIHPYAGWFWNRATVYRSFGFQRFLSEESLPTLDKRGPLVSDAAMTSTIMREVDSSSAPVFAFAVSLQGHGPYEPGRYPDKDLTVSGPFTEKAAESLKTYAVGIRDADRGLARLLAWASRRERPTVIAFFGDHLPPLGPVYIQAGYMNRYVADRKAPLPQLKTEHETPLVVWSNRSGPVEGIGSISPAFLPMHILRLAGYSHPYYTGFLGALHDRFPVVDRNMLVERSGATAADWARQKTVDPLVRAYRWLQYDVVFGKGLGRAAFFPETLMPPQASLARIGRERI